MTPHEHDAPAGATPRGIGTYPSLPDFLRKRSPEELEEWHAHGFISTCEYREALEKNDPDPES